MKHRKAKGGNDNRVCGTKTAVFAKYYTPKKHFLAHRGHNYKRNDNLDLSCSLERAGDSIVKANESGVGISAKDIKELYKAMYGDYSQQATVAANNKYAAQTAAMRYPWEAVMAKIGLAATGDYEKDKAAFESALRQLTQIAQGDQQAYLAQLQYEGKNAFGAGVPQAPREPSVSGYDIIAQINQAFINY